MKNNFENYKEYCDGLESNNDLSFLILYLRDTLTKLDKHNEIGLLTLCSKDINTNIYTANCDILTCIIEQFLPSLKYINNNISTKLVNQNVLVSVSKAKKLNSSNINWLSRRPGSNLKEKIASTNNKIMAQTQFHSFDTLENRLFKALCLRLDDFLLYKISKVPKDNVSFVENEMCNAIYKVKKSDYFDSIKRYQSTPPNNRLLGDKHYKNVRAAWLKINKIDDILRKDLSTIEHEISVVFFMLILQFLTRSTFRMQQEIILIDVENFDIKMFTQKIEFVIVDQKFNYHICEIYLEDSTIFVQVLDDIFTIKFDKNNITLHNKTALFTEVLKGNLDKLLSKILKVIFKKTPKKLATKKLHYIDSFPKNLVIDLYSIQPKYLYNDAIFPLAEKVILLKYTYDKSYRVLLGESEIIPMNDRVDIITFDNVFRKGQTKEISVLLECLRQYKVQDINFIYPDKFNEFQLKEFHKSNMHYFSKSMGMVFDFQYNQNSQNFDLIENDFILSIDYIYDQVTFTLIKAKFDETIQEKVPESNGIIWERYPTTSFENTTYINQVIAVLDEFDCPDSKLLVENFGVANLIENWDNFSFRFDDGFFHLTMDIIDRISSVDKVDINSLIKDFLIEKASLIGDGKVIKLCGTDIFKGMKNEFNWLYGYDKYKTVQNKISVILWSDYVPSLYLKRLDKNFTLCNGADVTVAWGVKYEIELENEFLLASGISKFEFPLVYGDELIPTNKAVLKSKAFPLKQPIACKITMVYEFGGEEPFILLFNSIESESAGFKKIKANFENISSYQFDDMQSPPFPQQSNWELFSHYPKRNTTDTNNLLEWTTDVFDEIQNKKIYDLDLESENVLWRVNRYGIYTTQVKVDGDIVKINQKFYTGKFDHTKNIIYFTKHDDKYYFGEYIAKDISYNYKTVNDYMLKSIGGRLFAFHTIFFNTRDVDDKYYHQQIENGYSMLKLKLSQDLSQRERNILFTIVGLISHLIKDDWFELVDTYLSKPQNDMLKAGLFLGDLTLPQQIKTFLLLIDKFNEAKDVKNKLIPILAIALWKSEKLLFNIHQLDDKYLLKLLDISIKYICYKVENIENLKCDDKYVKKLFSYHLEFVLAVLRLRELNELNIELSMNDKKIQSLVKALEVLKQSKMKIDTLLSIQTNFDEENPLLYMLLKYLYNDTLDETFTILAPTE